MEYSIVLLCFSLSLELQVFVWLCSFFVSGRNSLSASSTEFAFPVSCARGKAPPGLRLQDVFASEAIAFFLFRVLVVPKNKRELCFN